MLKTKNHSILFILLGLFFISEVAAQSLTLPPASPRVTKKAQIGISYVTVDYGSPAVRDRAIWGALVPYNNGQPFPWRGGANQNTTLEFTHDAQINGNPIPAGKYGFHIIPSDKEWTLIFNKNHRAWGSFNYDASLDQLRVKVTPSSTEFEENLTYDFENFTPNSVDVVLRWADKQGAFTVKYDVHKIVTDDIDVQLTGLSAFFWLPHNQAANYHFQNTKDYEKALAHINNAISLQANAPNQFLKVSILQAMGRNEEAEELKETAIENSTEGELNIYGYQQMNAGNTEEALRVFKLNIERHPDSWNPYDSYGEALANVNRLEEAIEYYEQALERAPEGQKQRIQGILVTLREKLEE